MSAGAPPVDCPSCRARLAQQPPQHCPACGLPLAGPVGRQLLAVDRRLAELAAERRALLARLRASGTSDGGAVASHGTGVATRSRASGTVGPFGRSLRAAGPQTLLASGGVLLLTIAAVVFTAVAWRDLSAVVRGGLIAAAALGCALATRRLVARELERTAEATAVLTVILLGVLLNGLWRAGLFELFSDGADIVTAGAAALAATSHLLAFWTGTRAPHVLTAWLAPTALVALGLRLAEALTTTSVGSAEPLVIGAAVLIAAVVAGAYAQRFVPRLARWRTATQIAGVVLWLVATLLAVIVSAELGVAVAPASTVAQSLASAALVAGAAGVALCARRLAGGPSRWWDPLGVAGAWLAITAGVTARIGTALGPWSQVAVLLPVAVGAAALWLLPERRARVGAVAGMLPVALLFADAFGRSAAWLCAIAANRITAPWTPAAALVPEPAPDVPTLIVSAGVVAVAAAVAAALHGRPALVATGGGAVPVLAAAVLAWPAGGGVVVAATAAGGAALAIRRRSRTRDALTMLAIATAVAVVCGLSGATATIAALLLAALAAAVALAGAATGTAGDRTLDAVVAAGAAGLLTADLVGLAAAVSTAATHDPGPVGVAVALVATVGWLTVSRARRAGTVVATVDVVAAMGMGAGIVHAATATQPFWLAVAFGVLAVAATVVTALRDDRQWMRWVATAAGSACSWTVLAMLDVATVEAYTVPPALVMLALGAATLRARPEGSSWRLLGAGLWLLVPPTVVRIVGDPDDLLRVTAAIVVGSTLAVAGRVHRLQAPLVAGVAALAVVAVTQHGVVTDVLPRWLLLAVGGVLLLWLSISYERQVRRVTVVRAEVAAMR